MRLRYRSVSCGLLHILRNSPEEEEEQDRAHEDSTEDHPSTPVVPASVVTRGKIVVFIDTAKQCEEQMLARGLVNPTRLLAAKGRIGHLEAVAGCPTYWRTVLRQGCKASLLCFASFGGRSQTACVAGLTRSSWIGFVCVSIWRLFAVVGRCT